LWKLTTALFDFQSEFTLSKRIEGLADFLECIFHILKKRFYYISKEILLAQKQVRVSLEGVGFLLFFFFFDSSYWFFYIIHRESDITRAFCFTAVLMYVLGVYIIPAILLVYSFLAEGPHLELLSIIFLLLSITGNLAIVNKSLQDLWHIFILIMLLAFVMIIPGGAEHFVFGRERVLFVV
jgi:hypothetical protein